MRRSAIALALAAFVALPAHAADFYAGKTVNVYVGFAPGGSYDLYARVISHHLGKQLAGNPTMVVQNKAGGGSINLSNFMMKAAPKDGTALAIVSESVATDQVMENPGIEYDATKFGWVGRMTSSASAFFAWHTSPTKTFADAQKRETLLGSSGSGLTIDTPRALNALAGAKFKLITGYRGSNEVALAMERGEVEVGYALWADFKARKGDWLTDKKVNLLFFMAGARQAGFPDVPISSELAASDEGNRILGLFASSSGIGRAVFTAPGVPAAQLGLLRAAFMAMVTDPEFQADARQANLALDPLDGAALQKLVAESIAVPKALVEKAKEARK
jgi:tripartite-type tricarboxylate transporter receptor subunit TctC